MTNWHISRLFESVDSFLCLLSLFMTNVFSLCNLRNLWIFPAMEFDPNRLEFKARV